MTVPPVLACRGLRKQFGARVAVDDVGFSIEPGETYGLLGPNGAGKTTTISMVCGLLSRDRGEVLVAGRPFDDAPLAAKAAIGYVPQDLALYPDLTGEENLRFFGRLYGLRGAHLRARAAHALELVGLVERGGDRVGDYSGGMRRRLNIAAGLLHEPALLVLDEPTAGVDPQSRHAILRSVEELGTHGLAVLYTTHYMEEAERLCDRIGILDDGRLVAEGTRRELVASVVGRDRIHLTTPAVPPDFVEACRAVNGVLEATVADGRIELLVREARRALPRLVELAEHHDLPVQSVEIDEPDLEAVFLHVTGKALRD